MEKRRKIDYSGYSLAAKENENKLVDNKKLCPFNCGIRPCSKPFRTNVK